MANLITHVWKGDLSLKEAIRKAGGGALTGDNEFTTGGGNRIYRYPQDHEWNQAPYIRFSCWKTEYNRDKIGINPKSTICLYMPMGIQQTDNAQWEMSSSGIVGAMMANGTAGKLENTLDSIQALATNVQQTIKGNAQMDAAAVALGRTYGDEILAAGATVVNSASSTAGALVGGAATYVVARQAFNELSKEMRVSLNPREFMLYRAPSMRTFSYDFRFIPSSEKEAMEVLNIIRYFRASMYPELASAKVKDSTYSFPDMWSMQFENTTGIPKVPPCALTNVNVSYNPNSMSFYADSGVPVEIVMNLQFAELAPINRKHVETEGF